MTIRARESLMSFAFVLGCVAWAGSSAAAETAWRTTEEMRRELQTTVGITWSAQSLRDDLLSLSTSARVAIWLDRRIDPSQQPEFSFDDAPLKEVLQRVATKLRAEVGYVGPVVYLGPASAASKLWTLAELRQEESRRLPAEFRAKWSLRRPVQWPELSTPRELLQAAADEAGCQIEGLDSIPHDLWRAANFPPLTIAERLVLILAGFDRTFEFASDGRAIRLAPLPERPALQREYTPRGDTARAATDLARQFPNSNIQRSGAKLTVTGSAEEHDSISRLLRGEPTRRTPTGPPETRYTMKVKNQPLGAVLRTLEVKSHTEEESRLKVSVDDIAREKLQRLVSFEVKEATLKQLLDAAMQGTGLTFQLEGKQLRITLADK